MVGTAAAMLGGSILSAGTSLIGGLLGKSAAQKAAEAQQQAAAAAGQKVEGAVRDSNPQIINNAANASDMALRAAGGVTDAAKVAGAGVTDASVQANALLNPYAATGATATGALNTGLADGGQFTKTPTMADIQIDPGFAFRLQQGEQALSRSSAARGGAVSGEAMKDSINYSQGAASQEYANAFGRYRENRQDVFGNLMKAADSGQAAAGKEGDNTTGAARYVGDINTDAAKVGLQANEYAGSQTYDAAKTTAAHTIGGATSAADYLTQQGNAKASGIVGGANALNAGLSGMGGAIQNGTMLNALLQNPATQHGGTIYTGAGGVRPPMGPPEAPQDPTQYLNGIHP